MHEFYLNSAFFFSCASYWIPKEGDPDMLNNGKTIQLTGPKTKTLVDSRGQSIAKVSKTTYEVYVLILRAEYPCSHLLPDRNSKWKEQGYFKTG